MGMEYSVQKTPASNRDPRPVTQAKENGSTSEAGIILICMTNEINNYYPVIQCLINGLNPQDRAVRPGGSAYSYDERGVVAENSATAPCCSNVTLAKCSTNTLRNVSAESLVLLNIPFLL